MVYVVAMICSCHGLTAQADADPSTVAPGVLLAATQLQHMTTFCTTSPEVLSSLGLGENG